MPRWIVLTLFALGLAMDAVVPAHASITTKAKKSSLNSLATMLVRQPDLTPLDQDIGDIRKRAQSGDAHAQMVLGEAYLFGTDVLRDEDKGLHWLHLAADQGYHEGMQVLGAYLVFMSGNKASYAQGLKILKKLARQGQPHDMGVYGIALLSSHDASDRATGFRYLQKAARANDPNAMLMLGVAYTSALGVSWNPFKAVHWYQQALKASLPREMAGLAEYQLGVAYLRGQGIEKDQAKGASLVRKATQAGIPDAAYTLSMMYRNGIGVPRNASKAKHWLRSAAQSGSPIAQFVLGMNYTLSRTSHRDYKQGIPWLERAAHQGYAQAYGVLGIMHRMGWGFPADAHAAAKSWMRGAQLGDGASAFMLAQIWRSQHDEEGDVYAVMWLAIAQQLGYAGATKELQVLAGKFRKAYVQKGLVMAQAWFKQKRGRR